MGDTLQRLRREHGLTQLDVSAKLGLTREAYSLYEKSKREPNAARIVMLANLFEVTADEILGAKGGMFLTETERELILNLRQCNDEDKTLISALICRMRGAEGGE